MQTFRCAAGALACAATLLTNPTPLRAAGRPDEAVAVGAVDPLSLYLQTGEVDTRASGHGGGAGTLAKLLAPGNAGPRHFVVQLTGPMRPEWRKRLEDAGVEVGQYLPMNAFIVTLGRADAAKAAVLEFVRWFDEYRLEWKIAPELSAVQRGAGGKGAPKIAVVVTLFSDTPAGAGAALKEIGGIAGTRVYWIESIGGNETISATIDAADLPRIASLPSVQFIERAPDPAVRNDTDRWIVQSNVLNQTPLYDHGLHGEDQIVGIIDVNVDRNHCSFLDSVNPIGPLHRKIVAYNTSAGAQTHGTHVAGTAVGDHFDNTATRGVAYLGRLAYNTIPSYSEASILQRLNLHHSQGARVHTNSWGDDGTTAYNSLCRGFDSFGYSSEDDLVCLAVTNTPTLKNPENAKNLLAVGASQDTPNQANHCSGGTGPTSDGRRKPEIYAPGCGTNSAQSGTSCSLVALTGTSMASPAVAATGMLVRQYFTQGFYPSGSAAPSDAFTPSGALVKAVLLNSAVDMTGIAGYPSTQEGWGRVLAHNSVRFQGDAGALIVHDVRNGAGLSTGGQSQFPLRVLSASQPFRVTLVWTEPPAASGAAFAAVNDLDLEVMSPTGVLYRGNAFASGQSSPVGARDDRNNVEQVHLTAPAPGAWSINIRGVAVNVGTQGFALVVTGDIGPPAMCACDWDRSGGLNSQDFFDFISSFFAGSADFNQDGVTDSNDFFDFVSCFFAGCP